MELSFNFRPYMIVFLLQYVDCIDTTFINPFPLDSINILVERWIQWFGPHPYECERD